MKKINKICIIGGGVVETDNHNYYGKASIVEYLHDLSNRFGIIDFVTHMEETHNYVSRINPDRVNVIILKKSRQNTGYLDIAHDFKRHVQVLRRILNKQTGVIMSNLTIGGLGVMLIAKMFAGRVVFYLGSDPQLTAKLKPSSVKGLLKRFGLAITFPLTAMLCDGILARGNACFLQSRPLNKNVIMTQPLILYSKFLNAAKNTDKNGTSDKAIHILYVGKLTENKGVHLLLQAFARLLNDDKIETRLTIAGSGEERMNLEQLAREYDISDKITFIGYIDEGSQLVNLYLSSDVLIVPTVIVEGFPRVIDEAMACGKPVICSRLGGMETGLSDDEVIFVTPGNTEDLYTALRRFAMDRQLRNNLEQRSLERAEKIMSTTAAEQHAQFLLGNIGH